MGMWSRLVGKRLTEASPEQIIASGAAGGQYAVDPIDGDIGFRSTGGAGVREVPQWTLEKQRTFSVAAYRINPMARAIIDTYTSFCIGDSGLSLNCSNPDVEAVANEFWTDPRNGLVNMQDLLLRDHMLMGESAWEMLVGDLTGITRYSPIASSRIVGVELLKGNPMWPGKIKVAHVGSDDIGLDVVAIDDLTGLRTGQVQWWPSWKATIEDRRGTPFLGPILDWLDSYDDVLSNLVDRTALARYLVWDVTLEGADADDIKQFVADRGGMHIPRSGSIEVHNDKVTWEPQTAPTGAAEDTEAGKAILTSVAAGVGLSKHWLAEADNSNRATSLTMAEPVRRRVGGVQNLWLGYMTELTRFAVDRAVAAGRLPRMVPATDTRTAAASEIRASQAVQVTGPQIAAADAEVTATTLLALAQGLEILIEKGVLSQEASKVLGRKAWEQYAGIPYTADLDGSEADVGDIATAIGDATTKQPLRAVRP